MIVIVGYMMLKQFLAIIKFVIIYMISQQNKSV